MGGPAPIFLAAALWALSAAFPPAARADASPRHAERGVSAYRAGQYDLARMFFAKALQDAVLKGREDWIAKATFNLVDLELDAENGIEAARLLEGLRARETGARAVWLWKRSQLAFLRRDLSRATSLIDSALALAGGDEEAETSMRLDRMRYLIRSGSEPVWSREYQALRKKAGRKRSAPLDAMAAAARGRFARADTLWRESMERYREQGRLAKVAGSLNQSAICLFALGRRAEAAEANARAVAIFAELGLEIPGLRAQALRLLLAEDQGELAKLRRDMDLLVGRLDGFDLQGILDEYSHSLRFGATGNRDQPGGQSPDPGSPFLLHP